MATVEIKMYRSEPNQSREQRKCIQSFCIETQSNKHLTTKRVSKIVTRLFPEYCINGDVIVIKTQEGWEATRSLESGKGCSYHYAWEYLLINEAKELPS